MANILLASLGESPVVVPVMYQLLKQKGIKFDKVQVLAPQGRWVPLSYDLVEEALQSEQAPEKILLPFEDANTERECLQYLQILAQTLRQHQQEKNMVYLSLAGGRKSMAALMAWIVPFFSCIQGLYHVIDPEKEQFPSVEEIMGYSPAKRTLLMKPDLETLKLVPIPYTQEQQTSYEIFAHLEEKLKKLQDNSLDQNDTIAAMTMCQQVMSEEKLFDVEITQMAADQYTDLYKKDANRARSVRVQYFQKMRTAAGVRALFHPRTDDVYDKSGPGTPYYSKSMRTMVRPVFYTIPNTHAQGHEKLTKVVICALETKNNDGDYRPLLKVTSDPRFSWGPIGSIDTLPQMAEDPEKEHILLVPLGTRPMIATQLYTLLMERENVSIQEIVLFYPGLNRSIHDGIELLKRAVGEEKRHTNRSIQLRPLAIPGINDIDSPKACSDYQQHLEEEIQRIQNSSPNKQVLLSLSGGRKGMTAMTIFAARNLGLSSVYHTLIASDLNDTIEQDTTISALNNMTRTERNDRLFLRSYDRSQFHLFRVPVLTRAQLSMS